VQYELIHYDNPDADLARTDLMELQGKQLPLPAAPAAGVPAAEGEGQGQASSEAGTSGGAASGSGGRYLGLRLAFTLPTACYATMLIRELTKQSTSVAHHMGLQH
jgi:tRNA pseudouridine13 synthase